MLRLHAVGAASLLRKKVRSAGHRNTPARTRGERILTIVAAANRDRDVFQDPEEFVIDPREEKPLTFGGGIHYCVGAELARLEGRVFLEELFSAYPDFDVDTETARLRQAFLFRGFEHLAVRLQ